MNTHHVFLMFSNYENLPCVIAEALTVGLPVISTDVGGISEMLNEENGILIAAKDETQLEEKLNSFFTNSTLYNRYEISENAKKVYNTDVVGQQFLELYHKILKN